jgi:hypothetical protein
MIVVRNSFVAKPGQASKLAAQVKDALTSTGMLKNFRVMTDMTGDFNTVILEHEAANIGEFEARMKDYATNEAFKTKMKGYTDLYVTGRRDIFQIV